MYLALFLKAEREQFHKTFTFCLFYENLNVLDKVLQVICYYNLVVVYTHYTWRYN